MTFDELLKFIDIEDERLKQFSNNKNVDQEKRVLYRSVKLGEEYGEFCDKILASLNEQRDSKLYNNNPQDLPEEFADVIITTLLLGKALNINIKEALEEKIKKINGRYNENN